MTSRVIVLGAGGHAEVVADVVRCASGTGLEWLVHLDDDVLKHGTRVDGAEVVGGTADWVNYAGAAIVCGIGDNARRRVVCEQVSGVFLTAVHPRATLARSVELHPGTVVVAGAVVNAGARIGRHVILNTGCSVDHHSVVGDYAHIAPGARLGGEVTVGAGALIGIGAIVLPGRRVGVGAVVGAGAVVIDDVPDGVVVVGCPARRLP